MGQSASFLTGGKGRVRFDPGITRESDPLRAERIFGILQCPGARRRASSGDNQAALSVAGQFLRVLCDTVLSRDQFRRHKELHMICSLFPK